MNNNWYIHYFDISPGFRNGLQRNGMQITNHQKFVDIYCNIFLFNLALRAGFIMPQTSDDSLFANGMKLKHNLKELESV